MNKRILALLFAFIIAVSSNLNIFAALKDVPPIEAETFILMERTTKKVLLEKDSDKRMYPASMTKILTTMLLLDYFDPSEIITMGKEVNDIPLDSSKAGHKPNEQISVENLVRALLIPSGNESGNVVAAAVYAKVNGAPAPSYKTAEAFFADLMNKKAQSVGAMNSNFVNPHGYHHDNHYSTARDMALISDAGLKYDLIKRVVAEDGFEGYGAGVEPSDTVNTQYYKWRSHNLLITGGEYCYPYSLGIKTGYTGPAGSCVTSYAIKNDIELMCVVMNASDTGRWVDSKNLFEYGYENYAFKPIFSDEVIIDEVGVSNQMLGTKETVALRPFKEYIGFYSDEEIPLIKKTVVLDESLLETNPKLLGTGETRLRAPIAKDAEVGSLIVTYQGKEVFRTPILSMEDIPERTLKSDIDHYFKKAISFIFSVDALLYWVLFIALILIIVIIIALISRRKRNSSGLRFRR